MHKLQFLCSNHRQWLAGNPRATANTCRDSFQRCLELKDEESYSEAARYAGAAFETAEIALSQKWQTAETSIGQFTSAAVLLVQLLYQLQEPRLAATVLGSTIARLERMLSTDSAERIEILAGCQRMQQAGDELVPPGEPHPATEYLLAECGRQLLH